MHIKKIYILILRICFYKNTLNEIFFSPPARNHRTRIRPVFALRAILILMNKVSNEREYHEGLTNVNFVLKNLTITDYVYFILIISYIIKFIII